MQESNSLARAARESLSASLAASRFITRKTLDNARQRFHTLIAFPLAHGGIYKWCVRSSLEDRQRFLVASRNRGEAIETEEGASFTPRVFRNRDTLSR